MAKHLKELLSFKMLAVLFYLKMALNRGLNYRSLANYWISGITDVVPIH